MPRRVLVLSASVGAGHLRAAQAVELALRELDPQTRVRNVDVLDLAGAAFRRLYGKAYLDMVSRAPHLMGWLYDVFDRPRSPRGKSDRLRLLVEKLNLRRFLRLLDEEEWDVIVNTHFLPAEIVASLKRKRKLHSPQLTVTTDFETHRLWVNEPCEHYFTATEEGALYLKHWGVPAERVSVTGIPIHPAFSRPKDRAECLKRQDLLGKKLIVLLLAGGFGVGPVEELYRGLLEIDLGLEIVVVSGKNEPLRKRLQAIKAPPRHRAKVLGFTDQMDELMAVADVVLSKPGGLTTSEVLARGAAMAIVNPIPGQESRNSDYLLEQGAAIKISHPALLPHKLGRLLRSPERLLRLKKEARRLGKPQAAFDVARMALAWPAAAAAPAAQPVRA